MTTCGNLMKRAWPMTVRGRRGIRGGGGYNNRVAKLGIRLLFMEVHVKHTSRSRTPT